MINKKIFLINLLFFIIIISSCRSTTYERVDAGDEIRQDVSIYSIQDINSPEHPEVGDMIWIRSVIVTAVDNYDEDGQNHIGSIWIQEPQLDENYDPEYSGILVYNPTVVPKSVKLRVGDVVDVYGEYEEFCYDTVNKRPNSYCQASDDKKLSEIGSSSTEDALVYKTGESISPDPVIITDLAELTNSQTAEKWEGVLLTIRPEGGLTAADDYDEKYGEFDIAQNFSVTDDLYRIPVVFEGLKFESLTGVLTWFFSFKFNPRSAEDIVEMEE